MSSWSMIDVSSFENIRCWWWPLTASAAGAGARTGGEGGGRTGVLTGLG